MVVVVEVVVEGKPQVPAAALTPPTRTVAFVLCFFNSVGGVPFVAHDSAVVAWRPLLREVTATVLAAAGAPLCMFWVALC